MNLRRTLTTFFYIIKIIFSIPSWGLKYYFKRRKAVKQFKKQLIASGVPPSEADELAKQYPFKFSDIMNLARGLPER